MQSSSQSIKPNEDQYMQKIDPEIKKVLKNIETALERIATKSDIEDINTKIETLRSEQSKIKELISYVKQSDISNIHGRIDQLTMQVASKENVESFNNSVGKFLVENSMKWSDLQSIKKSG